MVEIQFPSPATRALTLDAALREDPRYQRSLATQQDRTPSGLWPSDHAGVVAVLDLP
jgi:hypothetical protein